MTSWPAALSLLYRQYSTPASQGIPWPEISISFISGRMLPHDESSQAQTPRRFDSHKSMASSELIAIPINDGLSRIQSSSGSCWAPVAEDDGAPENPEGDPEPLRRVGLSEARRRAVVGSEPCR